MVTKLLFDSDFLCFSLRNVCLECYYEACADAPAVGLGIIEVGEAAYVFDVEEFKDVVESEVGFNVGGGAFHRSGDGGVGSVVFKLTREVVEAVVSAVFLQHGVVLTRKVAPQGAEAEVLAQFQVSDKRQAVEYLSVEVPRSEDGCVAVVEELHVCHQAEGVVVLDV